MGFGCDQSAGGQGRQSGCNYYFTFHAPIDGRVTQPTDCSNGLVVYSYIELVECGWSRSAVPPMATDTPFNGAWTTDQRRAMALHRREAEAHAARLRDCCPRNAELINVEEIAAAD
jgi:hypothetical protein